MKTISKLLTVTMGAYLAIASMSLRVSASRNKASGFDPNNCVQKGICGTTAGGVTIKGICREVKN